MCSVHSNRHIFINADNTLEGTQDYASLLFIRLGRDLFVMLRQILLQKQVKGKQKFARGRHL